MIYLRKGEARIEINNEEIAAQLEEQGFVRLRGQELFKVIALKVIKKGITHSVIPLIAGAIVFRVNPEHNMTAALLAILMALAIRDWFE